MTVHIENGDCLELMAKIPDKSVDLFICDLPYGETNCLWDSKIDLDKFWLEFKRLRKSPRVACIHFCSTKFGYTLIKSNPTMFKMDMVWKKRNKTGGLQSRLRPMRNHEMVYFFYEQTPKYNRDKYHKRIKAKPKMKADKDAIFGRVIDDGDTPKFHLTQDSSINSFEPKLPSSVIEEKDNRINDENKSAHGWDITYMDKPRVKHFDPALPTSIIEEKKMTDKEKSVEGWEMSEMSKYKKENRDFGKFIPANPSSVLEQNGEKNAVWGYDKPDDFINYGEGGFDPKLPCSMFESGKVFVGKRNHQTEKPLDILEFFLKYYSDEGDTILDPTMGSGSAGVACAKLNRNFIGFELTEKYFEVAKKRIENKK